jgi:hypothetical protein
MNVVSEFMLNSTTCLNSMDYRYRFDRLRHDHGCCVSRGHFLVWLFNPTLIITNPNKNRSQTTQSEGTRDRKRASADCRSSNSTRCTPEYENTDVNVNRIEVMISTQQQQQRTLIGLIIRTGNRESTLYS